MLWRARRRLPAVVREEQPDLVLLGKYGVGSDEWQTGPMLAELLGWPHASAITKLDLGDGAFTVHREIEGAVEVLEGRLPAVLTCEKGLNEPRYRFPEGNHAGQEEADRHEDPADVGVEDSRAR